MQPIIVPGMDRHRARIDRWFGRRQQDRDEPERKELPAAVFRNADGTINRRPALQGYATLYDRVFEKDGELLFLKSGCLIEAMCDSTTVKGFWIDHDRRQEMATTKTGLEFANTLDGLAFRLPLTGHPHASALGSLTDGERKCMSIGIEFVDHGVGNFCGHDVRVVSKANFSEVSLVQQGAVHDTFAVLVDLDEREETLWLDTRSSAFKSEMLSSTVDARVRRVTDTLRNDPGWGQATSADDVATARAALHVGNLNRWQTEETERLQAAARARL